MLSLFKKKNPPPASPVTPPQNITPVNPVSTPPTPTTGEPSMSFNPQEKFARSYTLFDIPLHKILKIVFILAAIVLVGFMGWKGYDRYGNNVSNFIGNIIDPGGVKKPEQKDGSQQNNTGTADSVGQSPSGASSSNGGSSGSTTLTSFKNQMAAIDDTAKASYETVYAKYEDYILSKSGNLAEIKSLTNTAVTDAQAAINSYSSLQIPDALLSYRSQLDPARSQFVQTYQKRIEGYNAALKYIDTGSNDYFDAAIEAFSQADTLEDTADATLNSIT